MKHILYIDLDIFSTFRLHLQDFDQVLIFFHLIVSIGYAISKISLSNFYIVHLYSMSYIYNIKNIKI